ncbi:hypothetical protein EsDP_00002588 [Epichloe bromicola]|uniref:Glycosyl hydrolase family 92 N-terminal domain-containing protein n=1 Tax=Epichloe bromicola TaxID=79588 RepID=A0ABQ0CL82_9HYPO
MVKLGPDLYTGSDFNSRCQPKGDFTGFTMLHESCTGGAPKYGVVSQMSVVGKVGNPFSDAMNDPRAKPDIIEVGYYKASLGSGTVLEMSASKKAGIHKYTLPGKAESHILVDASHVRRRIAAKVSRSITWQETLAIPYPAEAATGATDYYQALPWEYSSNAHHDLQTAISYMSGPARFTDRLDTTFKPVVYSGNNQFGNTLFNPGNEPSFTTPYLYNSVNRQALAVQKSRFIANSYYRPTPPGPWNHGCSGT